MHDPMHSDKSFEVRGSWVRWSRYELLNGVIVPAEDAERQEYDPWDGYRANAGKYRTVQQPYLGVMELHRQLKILKENSVLPSRLGFRYFVGPPMRGPQNSADQLILDWCNLYGLLGLVPVLSNSIRLPALIEHGSDEFSRKVTKRNHFRNGGIWFAGRTTTEVAATTAERAEENAFEIGRDPQPGVSWFNWTTNFYEEKALEHIRDFFLPTPFGHRSEVQMKDILFPCPDTPEFWRTYGEPIHEFTHWCEMFTLSAGYLSKWKIDKEELGIINRELQPSQYAATLTAQQSHRALGGLAQSAAPAFQFDLLKDTLDEERVSAGLLASYALMFLWDRADGRRTVSCRNCQRYFVSDEYRARYCSPRCRNTAQSRRYRSRSS